MGFGEYASRYADHLRSNGGVQLAAAAVLMALASGRIAVFYCTDPYVPGYGNVDQALGIPYGARRVARPVAEARPRRDATGSSSPKR